MEGEMIWHAVGGQLKIRIGQRVERADNPRHAGVVLAVSNSAFATIKWDNGWKENLPLSEIVKENAQ
jgi:hypothetical protein